MRVYMNTFRSRTCKSTSALDELQTPVHNPMLCNFSTDVSSTMHNNIPYLREPCTHHYATVSPKNLRFSMSREKSRAIERSFDAYKDTDNSSLRKELSAGWNFSDRALIKLCLWITSCWIAIYLNYDQASHNRMLVFEN